MKYFILVLFLVAAIFFSCNDEPKKTTSSTQAGDTTKPAEMTTMDPRVLCYSTTRKDSVSLKMEIFPNVVTGLLRYKLYEKDSNTGTIDGIMKGDTLVADYTFMSEGQSSVRQVAFIIKDNTATEGYGEMEEINNKMVFKNLDKLDFSKGITLEKSDCPIQ